MPPQSPHDADETPAATAGTPGYAIGHVTVRDQEKWRDYCSRVPATLAPWKGEVVFRAHVQEVFSGSHGHADTVVLRFPDSAAVTGWHESAAYQALLPLRDAAAEVTLLGFAGEAAR